ncbi:hypothetical protein NW762_009747 [Fusarium torreyae]|uniref:Protein FMP25, mitochondrial n=1 Tax=Fusarium torreyae TaxID=1237075 RepID=A0A9W8VC47_9HYPO|nr:hypothetical protein NW762_009747 [Fusarium torreyae]
MNVSRAALRRAAIRSQTRQPITVSQRQWVRHAHDYGSEYSSPPPNRGGKIIGLTAIFGLAAAGAYYYPTLTGQSASSSKAEKEKAPVKAELEFEKPRKKVKSKEDNRDLISSQHLQVKHSWEHPGVYAWGSNLGKVIDPNSNEKYVKAPRRISYFDDQVLRDLKLTSIFGAAVTEKGDLVQWGLGYNKDDPSPVPTLTGKDIVKIDVSLDRIIALSRKGNVYAIPASRNDQEGGLKEEQQKSSWSIWGSSGARESIHFRNLTPPDLAYGEAVKDISSGQEHCLMLTSKGRVFSAASSALEFPSKGQMGIAGLSWHNRPKGPYDQPHEVTTLKGFDVAQIAAGDYHSVVLDKTGRIFGFGDNSFGQLGIDTDFGLSISDTPAMVPTNLVYANTGLIPTVTSIAAGGNNTYFTVDAITNTIPGSSKALAPARRLPPITTDTWACGQGVYGTLGTGRWSHVSAKPTKVKGLSSLFEFDEKTNKMTPIKLKSISVGATHCSAIMDNVTEVSTSGRGTENETNWGADVVFWGGNEHYQLGTGKRTNLNAPSYIAALDSPAEARKEGTADFHRLCVTPRKTIRLDGGKGRKVSLEQKVECGKYVTGVYSAV